MDCSRTQDLLDARRAGELDARLAADIDAHVAGCAACSEATRALDDLARFVKGNALPPPARLGERVVDEARRMSRAFAPRAPAPPRALDLRVPPLAAAFYGALGALLACALIGVSWWAATRPPPPDPHAPLKWAQLEDNPYAAEWEGDAARVDGWRIEDGAVVSAPGTAILWWKGRARGDVEVDLDVRIRTPYLRGLAVVAHATRKMSGMPWLGESGLWGQFGSTHAALGRLYDDFQHLPNFVADVTAWHHVRFRVTGPTCALWVDGMPAGTRTHAHPVDDPAFDRVAIALDAIAVKNMKVHAGTRPDPRAPAITGMERGRWHYPWHDKDSFGLFVRQPGGRWIESKWGYPSQPPKHWATFDEVRSSDDAIELYDASRKTSVRLLAGKAQYRTDSSPPGQWWDLFPGHWVPVK